MVVHYFPIILRKLSSPLADVPNQKLPIIRAHESSPLIDQEISLDTPL